MWWPGRQEPEIDRPQPSPPRPRSAGQRIPFFSLETFLESCALTGTVLVCGGFYFRYLRRFQNALSIPQSFYTRGRTLSGRVVFVGDGDNFRLYHTPGGIFAGWDWLRRQPRPRQRKLADETIHVRLCGIDAPECKSYGRPGQPFGPESRDWLRAYLLGRKVRIRLYSIDQYQRAVAKATVRSWTGPKDVSSEMLRAGWAVVYESKFQAAFGSSKEIYQREEQYARDHKNGMWKYGRTLIESPAEYKKRMRLGGDAPEASNDVKVNVQNPEPPTWQFARMIRSIFSKRKSPSLSPAEQQNKDG
ncbi:hypothetical protein V1506DRAFT_479556 [Lipomyces tetrasporus]